MLLAVLAGACGSSGHSGSGQPTASPAQLRRVAEMVLADGDLPGYFVGHTAFEKLGAQLPPRGMRHEQLMTRLIRRNWIASANSTLAASGSARPSIFSDANLFARVPAAKRIWKLELQTAPGIAIHRLKPPPGAPAGASYVTLRKGSRSEYELGWLEGPVIGLLVVQIPAGAPAPGLDPLTVGAVLVRAAAVQSRRIAGALRSQRAV
ncbi:MAG TPA: hypothetical protein VGI72_07160 [Gaiellales bacterium]